MTTLPKDFEDYTRALMGPDRYAAFCRGMAEEAPASIRLNPFKTSAAHTMAALAQCDEAVPVPWCGEGGYLATRPNFTFDPLFHAGLYYVQEAASMFVGHVLRQLVHEPVLLLDLCAAPGGKTTAARAALPEGSVLFTNEPMKLRASVLSENVQKFGHPDTVVTNNFPIDYQSSGLLFDVVLTDVPCSGEGMFRKDEGAIAEWSVQNVEKCQQLQRSIINDIWPCLRPGGLLIYSTCTFNTHEDEENANWIAETLGADFVEVDTRAEWAIIGSLTDQNPMYRFIPGITRGEGLFMAVLRKRGEGDSALAAMLASNEKPARKRQQGKGGGKSGGTPDGLAAQWLDGDFGVAEQRGQLVAIPRRWHALYHKGVRKLHILHAGVALGMPKGRDVVPDASLALSVCCAKDAFPRIDVDYATALQYLRKEAVALPEGSPRGFVILTYQGHAMGFAKNIGNRANNLYPQEWKVKTTHLPEEPVRVLPRTLDGHAPHTEEPPTA